MVHCIIAYVSPEWSRKLNSFKKIWQGLHIWKQAHSNNAKCFKATLKRYLIEHVFYSLDEYYQFQRLWFFYLFILFIELSLFISFIFFILFIYIFYFNYILITIRYYVTWSLICSYFYTFMLWLIYVWVVLQIVLWHMLCTLCTSVYHYDCFYICKDLMEGEINKSINQSNNGN